MIKATMGKTKTGPEHPSRQILTDAKGKPTHVVLTVEEYERMIEILEDAEDIIEVERRLEDPEYVSLEHVKAHLDV